MSEEKKDENMTSSIEGENLQQESNLEQENTSSDASQNTIIDESQAEEVLTSNTTESIQNAEPSETITEAQQNESEISTTEESVTESEGSVEASESQDEIDTEQEEKEIDYQNFTKEQFLEVSEQLMNEEDIRKITNTLRTIKPIFNNIIKAERDTAREQFVSEGGDEGDFKFKQDKTTTVFYQNVKKINEKKAKKIEQLESQRQANYEKKNALLEELRKIVDSEESELSINEFKKIQEEWKNIGPVQPQQNKTLWANYNALLDRYYDKRSIYFELKELDRKKNLELKIALCEKAENLLNTSEKVSDAIKDLSTLHEEFKHIGPVPREEKDTIWERFKTASDKIYDKKRELMAEREKEREENLVKKLAIIEKVLPFQSFDSDKITEWNTKTKELIEVQKEWEAIRFIPREKIKEVSNQFWTPFKAFFNNKQNFFKKLDETRMVNLNQKEELIKKAEEAITNEENKEPKEIANTLKQLQREWKDIGPVPIKFKNTIYDKFKKICDGFFESKRKAFNDQENEFKDNLLKKQELCKEIQEATFTAESTIEDLKNFLAKWKTIGFVPRKDKNSIQKEFENNLNDAVERFPDKTDVEKAKIQLDLQMEMAKDNPFAGKKLQQREYDLRDKINKLEDDIANLKNNLGFFSNSKNANPIKEQVENQIKEAEQNLKSFKAQLKVLRNNRKKQEKEENQTQDSNSKN